MTDCARRRCELKAKIDAVQRELAELEHELQELDDQDQRDRTPKDLPMLLGEYGRYGRQMILPGFGLPGQLKLRQARILVVGAGGLGCPAMIYLAGAGVGHITVVDDDTVEASNLHRQVLHAQSRIGMSKVESAKVGMKAINPRVDVVAVQARFDEDHLDESISSIGRLADFSLVLDCTDNARTRYLLSDACVDANVTLVSGGAVGLEGWSGVWNLPCPDEQSSGVADSGSSTPARGPCLRCIYPQSKQDNSGNCEDDGILGTVAGMIGTLMANDAIKLLIGAHDLRSSMTLFSPMSAPMFRNIKLRGRKPGCPGCSADPSERQRFRDASSAFCGVIEREDDTRMSGSELAEIVRSSSPSALLIDVRPEVEFGICAIPGSINIPHTSIIRRPTLLADAVAGRSEAILLCRRGNDSLVDARTLRQALESSSVQVKDLRGGLRDWNKQDPGFPLY